MPKTLPEFIASYWTLAGDVVPLGPPTQEASPHDFLDRVRAAQSAGYSGLGLMHSDLMNIRRKYDFGSMKSILADHGMKYLELEFLVGWLGDGDEEKQATAVLDDMLETAEALNVRHLKVGPDMNAKPWPLDHMIERFDALCARAAEAGTAVALEIMPWSNLADLGSALAVIEAAQQPNGGLLLDIWHVARGNIPYTAITTIPKGLVHYVELDDADSAVQGTLLEDTLHNRRFCGAGDLDVPAFLRALDEQGYEGPFGIEILSRIERKRPFEAVAADAIRTARTQFEDPGDP